MTETLPAEPTDMQVALTEKALTPPGQETISQTVEKRVAQYVAIRDHLKQMKEKHDAELAPYIAIQNELTGWMQEFLDKSGAESIKTKAGTCYSSTKRSASLADPKAFMDFVIANGKFDLLDRKANSTAVADYATEHGQLPPGVNMSAIKTIGVRRASGT